MKDDPKEYIAFQKNCRDQIENSIQSLLNESKHNSPAIISIMISDFVNGKEVPNSFIITLQG